VTVSKYHIINCTDTLVRRAMTAHR